MALATGAGCCSASAGQCADRKPPSSGKEEKTQKAFTPLVWLPLDICLQVELTACKPAGEQGPLDAPTRCRRRNAMGSAAIGANFSSPNACCVCSAVLYCCPDSCVNRTPQEPADLL